MKGLTRTAAVFLLLTGWCLTLHARGIGETGSDRTYLEVWISWEGTQELSRIIGDYGIAENREIRVITVPHPESRLLSVLRGGGPPPDLIMISPRKLYALTQAQALRPLAPELSRDLDPRGVENFTLRGVSWALPFYYDTQLLFYNPELLNEAAHPLNTLSQIEKAAQELEQTLPVPLSWNAYALPWLIPLQFSFGRENLGKDMMTVHDEAAEKALGYLVELQKKSWFRPLEKDAMLSHFIRGDAGIILSGSYAIPHFEALGIPFALKPFPLNDRSGRPLAPLLDFKAFAIPRLATDREAAEDLLRHLTSPKVQRDFCEALSKIPADLTAQAAMAALPRQEALQDAARFDITIPSSPGYGAYKNIMWKLIRLALNGKMTPEEVLTQGELLLRKSEETW